MLYCPMTDQFFSVVIPNWNGAKFLSDCLDSLARQSYSPLEVIVVDNASVDESVRLVKENYPHVILIELAENMGFTGACNVGIRAANGDFIALLNNDTEVDNEWVAALVDAFNRYPQAGIIASKMLLFDRRDTIHTTGDFFTVDGRAGNRGVWQRDEGQYQDEEFVFSACGGAAAYRKTMLDEIGLLDDAFFFSAEDIDLAWRAQLAGWRCLYTPAAIVYHHLSATGGGVTASYYDGRNLIFVLVKNFPSDLWRKYGLLVLKAQLRLAWEALQAWRGREARARLRGMLAGLWRVPFLWRKRRAVQNTRNVSTEYLESLLYPPQT
ncbi:MAG: glycosyltransferase family 2 protein [Chloroflexi bacterium]|nr:MAG: glycosyltransferase family 2 protein [Phototrophicales bacterium]RMF78851.1 MAG: glycosyltransferase family 2 protein [Chloroflexota bacterium]